MQRDSPTMFESMLHVGKGKERKEHRVFILLWRHSIQFFGRYMTVSGQLVSDPVWAVGTNVPF